jgi:very-short-patch-repair endonuclease
MKPIQERSRKYYTDRKCPICGGTYWARKKALQNGKETTCSRACSYALRQAAQKKARNLVCAVCQTDFTRAPSHIKGKHDSNFCSPTCHYKGRSLGLSKRVVYKPYNHTEQGRTNRSKAAARLYASGKGLNFPKTELAVLDVLRRNCVSVTHQEVFEFPDRAYAVDFFFPNLGLVIELDNPSCHKRTGAHADFERDALIAERGVEVVRLWDNGSPDNAVRAVALALLERTQDDSVLKVREDLLRSGLLGT